MSNETMTYKHLGKCGTQVSAFGLGGWTTYGGSIKDEQVIREIIHHAFDAGINYFDIADVYARGASEEAMGKVLQDMPRHELVLATKVFWPMSDDINDRGLSRKHIMESIDKSLQRMGTDYVDLYFCHRFDENTPLEETARAMDDLVRQGKVLYWGTSEWTGEQLQQVAEICNTRHLYRPQVEQPQYSLLARKKLEQDVRPTTEELGMGLVVWSPLASGVLTGKYDDGIPDGSRLDHIEWLREGLLTENKMNRIKKLGSLATAWGVSRAQLALAWLNHQSGVSSVILGATRKEQLVENLGALTIQLTSEQMETLNTLFAIKED
ncbi:MAG: aldo/keto reductase [Myxococcales bacterium]|nr:aldo/keto reductase [Myxococcales bacterium]|tara:strand:- start:2930 stop:3898 length:969 start_codon:yes stop_codon:yes gene_type:complete